VEWRVESGVEWGARWRRVGGGEAIYCVLPED
jgi:hypothetical protein